MDKMLSRPRIYKESLHKIYQALEHKEDEYLWGILDKILNDDFSNGQVKTEGDYVVANMQTNYVNDLQDLFKICNVDLEEHELIGHDIKTSQTPMKLKEKVGEDKKGNPIFEDKPTKIQAFHVYAKLKPKLPKRYLYQALDSFVKKATDYAPKYDIVPYKPNTEAKFSVLAILDLHAGKRSWVRETGATYDTPEALRRFKDAFCELAQHSINEGCDEIVVPIGNDMINFDNPQYTTTNGTPQDSDVAWQYVIEKTEEAIIESTDMFADKINFKFIYVPGNHDEMFSYFICRYLQAWYSNHPNVEVDAEPTATKYYQNGGNLIVYNHFKDIKPEMLPMMMSVDEPTMFAQSWYREAHGGHFHTRSVKGVSVDTYEQEYRGITYRVLPSLCEADRWHVSKGYTGNIKMAQALIYLKSGGLYDIKPYIIK